MEILIVSYCVSNNIIIAKCVNVALWCYSSDILAASVFKMCVYRDTKQERSD